MGLFKKLLIPLFVIVFLLCFQKQTFAKSYYFPKVDVTINVQADGSIDVVEKRNANFNGSFTQIYWDIPLKVAQSITNVSFKDETNTQYKQTAAPDTVLRPPFTFSANRNSSGEHIEGYFAAYNEVKTFTLSYSVSNVITKYNDVGQLYWKIIGDNWSARTDEVKATVTLPETTDKNNIYVWGHGPLKGQSKIIDGKTTQFSASNVNRNTFVEIRELFPAKLVTTRSTISENALQKIKNEELAFQNKTITDAKIKLAFLAFLLVFIAGWIIFWAYIWKKYGEEYYTQVPKYVQNP